MSRQTLYIAVPVLGELENLENFFSSIGKQSYKDFKIYVCVNQYESWWDDPEKIHYCLDNARSLEFLNSLKMDNLVIIDRSSKGNGWPDKKGGVGWARKIIMDRIAVENKEGIIVSMDADTRYPDHYLLEIANYFEHYPDKVGLSIPYYHKLDSNKTDRHILRYEIFMRYYAMNMLRIKNPYNFTALGSALAIPLWAYNKIGGMTPVKSGEDFYLLQKLVKYGRLGHWVETVAYPSARFSDRVLFGTGPAIIKGLWGDWNSYPFYRPHLFDLVRETYQLFPALYERDMDTPLTEFLKNQFKTEYLWKPLRENYKDRDNFIKACTNKLDGLRILQFLRVMNKREQPEKDEAVLREFLYEHLAGKLNIEIKDIMLSLDFETTSVGELDILRNFLFTEEMNLRKLSEHL